MIKVFVGMPSGTGYPHPDVILNIFNQKIDHSKIQIIFDKTSIVQRMPIHVARNRLLQTFIQGDYDYLRFVDDDNPPLLDVLYKLLEPQEHIVSAVVPLRMYDKEGQALNIFYTDKTGSVQNYTSIPESDNPLIEISNCGTGCVLLSKWVCLDMRKKYERRCFQFDTQHLVHNKITNEVEHYTGQDKEEEREQTYTQRNGSIAIEIADVSEDLTFFNRVKGLGYKLHARIDAECYHYNAMPSKRILHAT